jgi:hypothetical protein
MQNGKRVINGFGNFKQEFLLLKDQEKQLQNDHYISPCPEEEIPW